jgi:hypothetical protein
MSVNWFDLYECMLLCFLCEFDQLRFGLLLERGKYYRLILDVLGNFWFCMDRPEVICNESLKFLI